MKIAIGYRLFLEIGICRIFQNRTNWQYYTVDVLLAPISQMVKDRFKGSCGTSQNKLEMSHMSTLDYLLLFNVTHGYWKILR